MDYSVHASDSPMYLACISQDSLWLMDFSETEIGVAFADAARLLCALLVEGYPIPLSAAEVRRSKLPRAALVHKVVGSLGVPTAVATEVLELCRSCETIAQIEARVGAPPERRHHTSERQAARRAARREELRAAAACLVEEDVARSAADEACAIVLVNLPRACI